jgi:uncharacterized protein YbcI
VTGFVEQIPGLGREVPVVNREEDVPGGDCPPGEEGCSPPISSADGDHPPRVSGVTGEALASISTGIVQLHSRYYGKGPTRAKTYLVDDTVVCILRGGFTTVEQTLIDEGRADAVYEIRRSFQQVMQDQFTKVVERGTGRKVIAYLSQIHHDPDLAVEIFVLEPTDEPVEPASHEQEQTEPSSDEPVF